MKKSYIAVVSALCAFFVGCTANQSNNELNLISQAKAAAKASGVNFESAKGVELHIYTWSDYFSPDVISSFEEALGCRICIDTFDSNESMYAKLKAGGTGYDIITPTSYQIPTMVRERMIIDLNHNMIPNFKANFDKSFNSQIYDPEFKYSVPYAVSYTGFCYMKDKIPEGAEVDSWAILENPALRGRITLLDDIREVIGAGLMYLGYSANSTNNIEIDKAVEQVIKWKTNIRKFDSESYKNEVPAGATYLSQGYSMDANQVIIGDEEEGTEPRDDIGFALPKEGFMIGFDEMVIMKGCKRPDIAYAFINYLYDPVVAAENMNYICGLCPVAPGIKLLDEDFRKLIAPNEETIKKGQVLKSFDDYPGVLEYYNKAWDKIKATE